MDSIKFLFIYFVFFLFARDPATRTFGLFLISTLAMITIGVIVGIIAGNTAHYRKNFYDHRSRYF
jgi:ABC-type proline/glycine betaine transport system permease subunit